MVSVEIRADGRITMGTLRWAYLFIFFFSSRRRHTRFDCDWSSDVCSSDLSGHRKCQSADGSTGSSKQRTSLTPPLQLVETTRYWPGRRGLAFGIDRKSVCRERV